MLRIPLRIFEMARKEIERYRWRRGGASPRHHQGMARREVLQPTDRVLVRNTRMLSSEVSIARMWTCAARIPSTKAQARRTAKAVRGPNRSRNGTGSARRYLKRVVSATEGDGEGIPIEKCA